MAATVRLDWAIESRRTPHSRRSHLSFAGMPGRRSRHQQAVCNQLSRLSGIGVLSGVSGANVDRKTRPSAMVGGENFAKKRPPSRSRFWRFVQIGSAAQREPHHRPPECLRHFDDWHPRSTAGKPTRRRIRAGCPVPTARGRRWASLRGAGLAPHDSSKPRVADRDSFQLPHLGPQIERGALRPIPVDRRSVKVMPVLRPVIFRRPMIRGLFRHRFGLRRNPDCLDAFCATAVARATSGAASRASHLLPPETTKSLKSSSGTITGPEDPKSRSQRFRKSELSGVNQSRSSDPVVVEKLRTLFP